MWWDSKGMQSGQIWKCKSRDFEDFEKWHRLITFIPIFPSIALLFSITCPLPLPPVFHHLSFSWCLSSLFSVLFGPVLPLFPSLRTSCTDSWIQQTDASGNRLDCCLLREPPPCTISLRPVHPACLLICLSPFPSPFLQFSFPCPLFFHSKSRLLPSLLGKLKLLSFHLYLRCRLSFSLFMSPLISLCISLPFPFFSPRGQTTRSGPLYLFRCYRKLSYEVG